MLTERTDKGELGGQGRLGDWSLLWAGGDGGRQQDSQRIAAEEEGSKSRGDMCFILIAGHCQAVRRLKCNFREF